LTYLIDEIDITEEALIKSEEVVERSPILVIGIDCRTSNAIEAGPQDISKLWEKFYNEDVISRIPNKISNEVIALYCEYESDYSGAYSVVIGCPVSSIDRIPEEMVAKIIPGGSYAIFRAIGEHPKALIETWFNIWKQASLDRAYTSDFELYGDKFWSNLPKEVEVCVAVYSKKDCLL